MKMRSVMMCVLLGSVVSAGHAVTAKQPGASAEMDQERLSIYRDFLASYDNGSGKPLNLSKQTETFEPGPFDDKGCLKGFTAADLHSAGTHVFQADAFPSPRYHLVDPATHEKRDPGDAIRRGESVDSAVEAGFAAGIFTFSEIVFDASHTHAAFKYSFVCGGLCGHGSTVVYERKGGVWRQEKRGCSRWIS